MFSSEMQTEARLLRNSKCQTSGYSGDSQRAVRFGVLHPVGARDFLLSAVVQTDAGSHRASCTMDTGIKRPGVALTTYEVKNKWSDASIDPLDLRCMLRGRHN